MTPRRPNLWLNASLLFISLGLLSLMILSPGPARSLLLFTALFLAGLGILGFRRQTLEQVGITKDSAEREGEEGEIQKLSAERDRLVGILQGMKEGVAVTDSRGTITLANPAFYQMFQLESRREGKTLLESLLNKELQEHLEVCLKTREEVEAEVAFRLGSEEKICRVHLSPLPRSPGQEVGAVLVFLDLTTIRRLERARQEFVANVSHELKTPLTNIRGYAETLLDSRGSQGDLSLRFIEKIARNAGLLENLIEDLLKISEIESGRREWNPEPVALKAAVEDVERLFTETLEKKRIQFELTCPAEVRVLSEPAALKQILANLIDNAVKYNREGGKVRVASEDLGKTVRITVTDTGMGIPAKDLPRIFERFYRVDKARSREMGGTGLGLSIVKHLVQAQGGELSVESREGQGTTFLFTLPKH